MYTQKCAKYYISHHINILSLGMLAQMFKYVYTSIIIVLSIPACIYIIIIFFAKPQNYCSVMLYYISFPMPFYSLMVIFKSTSLTIFWDLEAGKCNRNRCI